jgi:hypothetical protein
MKKKGKRELLFIIYNVLYVIACNDHIKTELYFIALSKKYIKKEEEILDRCVMRQNNIKH